MRTAAGLSRFLCRCLPHSLKRNPEFLTLLRAMDRPWSHPDGFAPLDAAPVTWIGDNRHTSP
jgi:hypothetical protein